MRNLILYINTLNTLDTLQYLGSILHVITRKFQWNLIRKQAFHTQIILELGHLLKY